MFYSRCRIYGPLCILYCLKHKDRLPSSTPVFSMALSGLTVCITGVPHADRVINSSTHCALLFVALSFQIEALNYVLVKRLRHCKKKKYFSYRIFYKRRSDGYREITEVILPIACRT